MTEELKTETLDVLIEDGVATVLRDKGGPKKGSPEGLCERVLERLQAMPPRESREHVDAAFSITAMYGTSLVYARALTPTGRGILEGWDFVAPGEQE